LDFFIEFNTSGEDEKDGILDKGDLGNLIFIIHKEEDSSELNFKGLMTMGTYRTEDREAAAKECFSMLRKYRDQADDSLSLSMGMSSDYKIALENGATHLRIGTLLFE